MAAGMVALLMGGRMRPTPRGHRAPRDDGTGSVAMKLRTPVPPDHISPTPKHPGPSGHLPAPVLSAVLGRLQGQKQPLGYSPKLYGSELSHGWPWSGPGPVGLWSLVPTSPAASGAGPEHPPPRGSPRRGVCLPLPAAALPGLPLPLPGSWSSGVAVPRPQDSDFAVPRQPGPLLPSSPLPSFG